ncbi:MAG: hypothetical protein D6707_04800, partial [Bacteroidetes bacterium]
VHTIEQLEKAVSSFIHERHQRIKELSIEPHLIEAIGLNHDLNNVRILFKLRMHPTEGSIAFSTEGVFAAETFKNAFENPLLLPQPLKDLFLRLQKDFEENQSLFRIEMQISQFYLNNLFLVFTRTSIPFLENFIRFRIDLTNLTQLLRWQKWVNIENINWDFFNFNGFLDRDFFKQFLGKSGEQQLLMLSSTPYGNATKDGIDYYLKNEEIWLLEKQCDDFLTDFCKETRYTAFGVEPLISYLWFSLQELRNIHLILLAKYINLDEQMIKDRLRKTYE